MIGIPKFSFVYSVSAGYVRMVTNLGPLNLELHCDMVPKACENFIKLCQKGYYNRTVFHRSIRNFMVNFISGPLRMPVTLWWLSFTINSALEQSFVPCIKL